MESVYTADLKSAALWACEFESRPRYQNLGELNMLPLRTYVNLEQKSIEVVLEALQELEEIRGLKATEKFVRLIFKKALDKVQTGM